LYEKSDMTSNTFPPQYLAMKEWYLGLTREAKHTFRGEMWRFFLENHPEDDNKNNFYFKFGVGDEVAPLYRAMLEDLRAAVGIREWMVWGQMMMKVKEGMYGCPEDEQQILTQMMEKFTNQVGIKMPKIKKR
jgi:hypothetical protein